MDKLISIGKILNFHGIKGEVKVGYTAGKENQLKGVKNLYAIKNFEKIPLTVESIRFHKNIALIKFKELNSVNDVIELKGTFLKAPKDETANYLEDNEFYIDDLVGLGAYDSNGNHIGAIQGVLNVKEEDLLSVKTHEGKEHLIPFVKELVPEVNIKEKKVIINEIPGLIDNEGETLRPV